MAFENLLSTGAISKILDGQQPANPVLQMIGYKPMTPDQMVYGSASEELRYRLMLGDGQKAHQYCVITNQDTVEDIKNGLIDKYAIVRVTSYRTVEYGDGQSENKRTIIYILNMEQVKTGAEVGRKLTRTDVPANQTTPPPPQQQQQASNPAMDFMRNDSNFNRPFDNQPMRSDPMNRQGNGFNTPYDSTQARPYPTMGMSENMRARPSAIEHQTIGIAELTPYIGKWVIKGRVTSKSAIREYNNQKGGGKLFNFTLTDKSGEIKITSFNADCERVFPIVEMNKVYHVQRGTVKNADKRYTTADFEITLNSDSLVEEVMDSKESHDVPLAKYNFVSIASLPVNQPVDLIGAVLNVEEVTTVMSKTKNKELKKRNITIVDMSRHSISVTIWGAQADTFFASEGDIFVTKCARVGTYGGKSASAGDSIFINPDIPEVRKIKSWFSNLLDRNFTCVTQTGDSQGSDTWKHLGEMLDLEKAKATLATSSISAQYAKVRATLISVGKNPVYKACPTEGCNKKLVDTQNGELKCEKCQQTYSTFKYRYMTSIEIGDATASTWTTLWDEKAEFVLGMKPQELESYMKMENKEAYERAMTKPNFKSFLFTLRMKTDNYNNEERVKLHVVNIQPLNTVNYSKKLIDDIKGFAATGAA